MERTKPIWATLLLILFLSCSQNESESDENYILKNNDCLNVKETEYNLCLESVSDSRCPSHLVCIWEGNASANLLLISETDNNPFTLNTFKNFQRDTILNKLKIELIDVLPYPSDKDLPSKREYRVKIKITKL